MPVEMLGSITAAGVTPEMNYTHNTSDKLGVRNMEVYVRVSETAVTAAVDDQRVAIDHGIDHGSIEGLPLNGTSSLNSSLQQDEAAQLQEQQEQQQQQQQQEHEIRGGGGVFAEPITGLVSTEGWQQEEEEKEENKGRTAAAEGGGSWEGRRPMPVPLRRREGMSDVWQHQGAFRSNRKSMKSMFEEFTAELEAAKQEGKSKGEVGDIFSFTSVGHKHLVRDAPSEDRIAIHQAVVPTIDEADKKELGIDSIDTAPFAMFGVFDGHGGSACAEFLKNSVSTVLAHSPVLYDEDLTPTQRRAFATADSFEELEKVHNDWAHIEGDLSGSTAILSTFQDGVLVMAGVGDSAGLYVDHMGNTHNLCPQHSTSNQREVERVLSMGGTIVNNRVAGCLMPTRTIGDLDCKKALGAIVSPHPELKLAAIYAPPDDGEPHDEPFIVIASDGLWDKLSFEHVAFITRKGLRTLRAHEAKERQKQDKKDAKEEKKRTGGGGGGGSSSSSSNGAAAKAAAPAAPAPAAGGGGPKIMTAPAADNGGSSTKTMSRWQKLTSSRGRSLKSSSAAFPGSAVLPPPAGIGPLDMSKSGRIDSNRRLYMDGSRAGGGYLDSSIRGLDASIRGGHGAAPIPSATLDSSMYAGLRIEQAKIFADENLHEVLEGVPTDDAAYDDAASDDAAVPHVKPVITTSTSQTAGVRTAGTADQNVAKLLVRAAIRADSLDDISVVVVTFKGAEDKSPPGSRR